MATNTLKVGSKIPDFKLIGTDEKEVSLNDFSDKEALIIIFSCNHCPYVQAYEDRIKKIAEDYSENVVVAAINSNDAAKYNEDSFEGMKQRAKKRNFNFPYLRDEDQSAAKAFDATHTPEVFVFDSERKLAYHGKIDDNWQDENQARYRYLRDALDEILEGNEVSVPETFSIGCTIKWKS